MSHKRDRLPRLRAAGDGTRILVKDYAKTLRLVPVLPFAVTITIRAGLRTDGASIPPSMRRFIGNPFDAVRLIAATLHDALYLSHLLPRIVADFIYYLALRQCSHMPRAYAAAEYLALRARGKAAWNEKTPAQIAEGRRLVRVRFKVWRYKGEGRRYKGGRYKGEGTRY